jgi:hypothetical protein
MATKRGKNKPIFLSLVIAMSLIAAHIGLVEFSAQEGVPVD